MRDAFIAASTASLRMVMSTGTDAGHPYPNEASVAAARRALTMAGAAAENELLVVLLSGGASAMMALPAEGLSLADKQNTVAALLSAGADIHRLNTVRKHVSAIKGGQLAAATRASVLTLVVSDVVGDDVSMIASGPTTPDPTTFADAVRVLDAFGGRRTYPRAVVRRLERGVAGDLEDTPKPGDPRLARSVVRVIGNRGVAVEGARVEAEALGYHVHVIDQAIVGEARRAGASLISTSASRVAHTVKSGTPVCILASGETTVRVTGKGKGGRNQELALGMLPHLSELGARVVAASIGTDGIDGPTEAAGALVDSTTAARAAAAGLHAEAYLNDNNTYEYFDTLDDLIRTGPTMTNVGDVQIILTI
jgi:hydroxypyruvate reductase